MRFIRFTIPSILFAATVAACGGTKAVAEDNSAFDDEIIEPYYISEIATINGKTLGFLYTDTIEWGLIAYDGAPLIFDPTLEIDSLSPASYRFDNVGRSALFNLADTACFAAIRDFNAPLVGFKRHSRFEKKLLYGDSLSMQFEYIIDYPVSGPATSSSLSNWIIFLSEKSLDGAADATPIGMYTAFTPERFNDGTKPLSETSVAELNDCLAQSFYDVEEWDWPYQTQVIDLRTRIANDRFVTYRAYNSTYLGGAHGMPNEYLISYDLINDKPINNAYLFRPGTDEKVKSLVLKAISQDAKMRECYPHMDEAQILEWVTKNAADGELGLVVPQAGLLDDTLVFSYQPYQLSCFANGCFHIKVPYSAVENLLTPQAKALIGPVS